MDDEYHRNYAIVHLTSVAAPLPLNAGSVLSPPVITFAAEATGSMLLRGR